MKFGVFTVVDEHPDAPHPTGRLHEAVALAEASDSAGLSSFWVAEHHFHTGGVCPSPPVLLAAAAARATRIRLGSLVSVLPFHEPIELAEQYAMVDQLTGGRLNFGVGSGYIPMEFEGFGIDPAHKRERFDRSLDTILTAFQGGSVPVPGHPERSVRINVLPVQRPYPPLTIAAQRREALPFIARRGASLALIPYATVADIPELASEIAEFRAHQPARAASRVAVAVHLYIGPAPEKARRHLQQYLDSRLATQSSFYLQKVERDPRHASAKTIEESGLAVLGSPDEARERLSEFSDAGVDDLLGIVDFGGLPLDDALGTVRALGGLKPL